MNFILALFHWFHVEQRCPIFSTEDLEWSTRICKVLMWLLHILFHTTNDFLNHLKWFVRRGVFPLGWKEKLTMAPFHPCYREDWTPCMWIVFSTEWNGVVCCHLLFKNLVSPRGQFYRSRRNTEKTTLGFYWRIQFNMESIHYHIRTQCKEHQTNSRYENSEKQ